MVTVWYVRTPHSTARAYSSRTVSFPRPISLFCQDGFMLPRAPACMGSPGGYADFAPPQACGPARGARTGTTQWTTAAWRPSAGFRRVELRRILRSYIDCFPRAAHRPTPPTAAPLVEGSAEADGRGSSLRHLSRSLGHRRRRREEEPPNPRR